jgi:acetolactate synthase-1/2/3 large subunit
MASPEHLKPQVPVGMDMSATEVKRAASAQAPQSNAQELNGSEILVRCLQAEQVKYLWGYPGGAVLYIYDALYKQDTIQHVLVRHEQAAVHAADGYSRATGEVGVALVTSGPGVTNAVTGIATAYMDSIPMVIITGQVPTPAIGLDAFQECDTVGITRPIVKHNFLVKDVNQLAMTLKKAFHIARTGRPGPVVVDVPKDVSLKTAPFHYPERVDMRSYNPVRKGHGGQIRKAVQLLLAAKRPYIYTGGGVILGNASAELRQLVELLGYPCTNTLMGLGAMPASDPRFLGMLGMHGTYEANMTMQNCDVLLAVGARFDDRVIGNPAHFASVERKIIHVDIDPSSISKRVRVDIPIVGDVKDVLTELIHQLTDSQLRPDSAALSAWWSQVNDWRKRDCLAFKNSDEVINPQYVVQKLWELTRERDTYITSDVGQHQMWAAQYYRFEQPRRWINSGGLGTMGVGLPYAMGIKLAKPESDVFCITGEGSIQMCLQELSTCKQYDTAVKVVSLNNRYLGMVRQWQELFYEKRYASTCIECQPDFVKLAEAYGAQGFRATRPDEVEEVLRIALASDAPALMDFRIKREANVWPMVPAGSAISDMLGGGEA